MANPPPKILKLNILLRSQYFAKNPKGKPNIWIWHLYFRFLEPQGWSGMSSTTPLSKVEDRSVLTRRIDTYKNVVFTKIASNYIIWSYNNSEQSSRLTCPPQIQLKSRRMGAVLTRRMDTYKEVVLTKVASNHTKWWYNHSEWSMMFISILYVISSKFCKVSFLRFFCLPHQDCTHPLAL